NVFLLLDGQWLTPPLDAGVLPGVMRGVLLDDPAWRPREARLTLADLRRAGQVVVCNALRGALRAHIAGEAA
ncbi:MAG: aminotransferase class IV, partial [Burkholderiaceae bacterium]